MTLLFFDTETTGKYQFHLPPNHPDQPNICQIAGVATDDNGKAFAEFNTLVQPNGWEISPEAQAIHKITLEDCQKFGLPIGVVLDIFEAFVEVADTVVAHNINFDQKMILSEIYRLNGTDYRDPFFGKTLFCTMLSATDICKIPSNYNSGYKWPKLSEAYRFFFDVDFANQHSADADVKACRKVYFALKNEGVL